MGKKAYLGAASLAGSLSKATDIAMSQPKKADLHSYGVAQSAEAIAYRERLDNVSHTAATADNVINVITDPKKILGLIMLIGLICLVVWLLKDQLKSLFDGIGSWFKDNKDKQNSKDLAVLAYSDSRGLTEGFEQRAQSLADRIYSAISWTGDNEEAIYSVLREVKTSADWLLLQTKFGSDKKWSKGIIPLTHSGDLIYCLTDNLEEPELAMCRSILTGNGVPASAIGF